MAITNNERVGKALDLLKDGLGPFAEREFGGPHRDAALGWAPSAHDHPQLRALPLQVALDVSRAEISARSISACRS